MVHELKIHPEFMQDIIMGRKTFEVRKNDKNYRVGDTLVLCGWDGQGYTGKIIERSVTYILDDPKYVKEGFVTMSLAPVGM